MVCRSHDHLVKAITRAALVPEAWQGVTDAIVEAFPGTKTGIIGYNAAMELGIPAAYSGYDPSFRPSYEAHYSRVIPRLAERLALPLGQVVHDRKIVSEEELLRSEFYNDWLRPQGDPRHGAIVVLQRDPGRMITFAARVEQRAAERTMAALVPTMRAIGPLMQHALEVNRMALGLRLDAALLRHGLEPAGAAVLLLGAQGAILYANANAEAHLAEGSLICHNAFGRLCFPDAQATERLGSALDLRSRNPGAAFRIHGSGSTHQVLLMRVTPDIVEQMLPLLMRAGAPALLVVLRPVPAPADAITGIARRLRLTRAEAEVALALSEGATVTEVAQARGVSVHTIREQVSSALGKTGARRQADLIRMVLAQRHVR